ncbi:hypothetical protein [Methyloligella solikamskensis]|uniref:Uncharacterized protein n=1 Tax=Methyloligella solikamskensis TaxID=1177756 RepID=A0ABW3J710_9HYPH
MDMPKYINLNQARLLLDKMGVNLSDRQIKRAAEPDVHGRRKLPFFIDPSDGKLKIERGSLVRIYNQLQVDAEKNLRE